MTQGYQLKSMAAAVGLSWSCKTISHTNGGAGLCTVVCWLGKHFYEPPQPVQFESIQSYDMGKYLPHSLIHWKWSEKIIFKLYSSSCQSGWIAYLINVEECALERWTLQSYLAPTPNRSRPGIVPRDEAWNFWVFADRWHVQGIKLWIPRKDELFTRELGRAW